MVKIVRAVGQDSTAPSVLGPGPNDDGASRGGDPQVADRAAVTVDLDVGKTWVA